jgi:septum formation topological specificity factor MinE
MRVIGIRAAPKSITFVIYDSDTQSIINAEDIKVPLAFKIPDALKYIRNNLLDVLREYQVSRAGIRITESTAQKISVERIQIEGVIQEAFASSLLENYYVGQISSISAKVGIDRGDFKKYIDGSLNFAGVDNWDSLSQPQREAMLCALGAIHD